ncbi:uncharacterized protein LOC131199799 isoform X2 [Ahaetulla prasina]|uniref:uncharacterized protein LOC131199799 isoform X2 n=1 Tax=Ahaetulla prasina TaxID=499056 RepID=UPI002648A5A6|nr:uncharacterized protein LOC131199799 isoform X2 [Ahaetulla prasina]
MKSKSKGTKASSDKVQMDPMALKKKLSKMSSKLGAFAVLSSLLVYLTDLVSNSLPVENKKVKWLESLGKKMSAKPERQSTNNGIRPTKFQILQSRFMNSHREPFRKKPREVGKLIIKEKSSPPKNGLNSIISKFDRNSLIGEENSKSQEKTKWISLCGKNTVKNVLKKFIAAEEKEAKEKQPDLKKNLPKIINKNSVFSKMKEKFEQTSNVCSAIDVRIAAPHARGREKTKKDRKPLHQKAICKAETKILKDNLRVATNIYSNKPQLLVCTTVPIPKFHVAVEINHPCSWAINTKYTIQLSDNNVPGGKIKDSENSIQSGENGILEHKEQKRQLQRKVNEMPMMAADKIDMAEASESPVPNTGNIPLSMEEGSHVGRRLTLPLDQNQKPSSPKDSKFSNSANKGATQTAKNENSSTLCPTITYPTKEIGALGHQETKEDKISAMPEGLCRSKETEIELTASVKDPPPFASQKCFSKQKVLENTLPFHSPVTQASCNTKPSIKNQQSSFELAAVDKMPLGLKDKEDFGSRFSDGIQDGEKLPDKELFPKCLINNDHKAQQRDQNLSDYQLESKNLPLQPTSQQNYQDNHRPNFSNNSDQALTSKGRDNTVKGNDLCNEFEKHYSSLPNTMKKSRSIVAIENSKAKSCSINTCSENNTNKERVSLSDWHSSQSLVKELLSHESHNVMDSPGAASEKCHLSSLEDSAKAALNIAEVNSPLCKMGNLPMPASVSLPKNENDITSCSHPKKCPSPFPSDSLKPQNTPKLDDKTMHNLSNDLIHNEKNVAEDKDIGHQSGKHPLSSKRKLRRPENTPAHLKHKEETQLMSLGNDIRKQQKMKTMSEEKSEKSYFPSQNEVMCLGTKDAENKVLPETAPHMSSLSVIKEEEKNKTEDKNPAPKMAHTSKTPQKLRKNAFTKNGGGITETNVSQTQQSTPPKSKPSDIGIVLSILPTSKYPTPQREPLHHEDVTAQDDTIVPSIAKRSKYQIPPREPAKEEGITVQDNSSMPTIVKHSECQMPPRQTVKEKGVTTQNKSSVTPQLLLLKKSMKDDNTRGNNAQDNLQNKKISSSGNKMKPGSNLEKMRDNSSNSNPNQLPFKHKCSKNQKNNGTDETILNPFKKNETSLSPKELKTDPKNMAVAITQKPSLNDSRSPHLIAKGKKHEQDSKKYQLLSSDVTSLNKQQDDNVAEGKELQQIQTPKDYMKSKSNIGVETYKHQQLEKSCLPSNPETRERNDHGKKVSLKTFDKCRRPTLSHDKTLSKEKISCEYTEDPKVGTSNKTHLPKQKNTQHSSSKYQIPGTNYLSGLKYGESKEVGAAAIDENEATLDKYKAKSYSEETIPLSFKPLIIRAIDTIKLDN